MDSIAAKLAEYETLLKLQMAKIEELAEENERLRSAAGAHDVLKEIFILILMRRRAIASRPHRPH